MRLTDPWIALALVAATAAAGAAQDVRYNAPRVYDDASPRYVVRSSEEVISLEGLDPVGRLREVRETGAERSSAREGSVRGGVGNAAVSGPGGAGSANVGFTYLTPLYSHNDFQRAVPQGFEGLFPVFGNTGRTNGEFAFSPRIDLNYQIKELDLGVSTAGTFLNLTGRVERQGSRPGLPSAGQFTAQSGLTIVTAIPIEFGRKYELEGGLGHLAGSQFDVRLGSRFISVDQHYTGATVDGLGSTSSRYSSQTYRGLGVTASVEWQADPSANRAPFVSARQSLTIGENHRNAAVTVTAPGVSFADNRSDTKTLLSPVTEVEVGLRLVWDGAVRTRDARGGPKVVVRVAAVGQYYYGMGPLSAGPTGQDFRRSDLFLVGGYLQAGLEF